MPQTASPTTLLDALATAIRAAAGFNRHEMAPPAAILWTDPAREWEAIIPALRNAMPELLTFGTYDAATKSGPAIWCKAVVGGAAAHGVEIPPKAVPVVYMPGVAKEQMRGVDACPSELRPLVELQYRGVMWTQLNGRDWTVRAFLTSADGGLSLRVARDAETGAALLTALPRLMAEELASLQAREIDAADLGQLVAPDPIRNLLDWMNNQAGTRSRLDAAQWAAFAGECKRVYGFDPQTADVTKAGEQLATRKGPWAKAWDRYVEAPQNYPGIVEVLRRSKPAGVLFADTERYAYPQDNEQAEDSLRAALLALAGKAEQPARDAILELERQHAARRSTVWAALDVAPLAQAMEPLADLAIRTQRPIAGATMEDATTTYASEGWKTDAAAMRALSWARTPLEQKAIGAAVRAVYAPWLDKSAFAFQHLAAKGYPVADGETLDGPGVVLFADGLRLDVARWLEAELLKRGLEVSFSTRLAAVPTATPTAKPAVSPVWSLLAGNPESGSFTAIVKGTDKPKALTADSFRRLLPDVGFQSLGPSQSPEGAHKFWTEFGTIDKRGHSEGAALAALLNAEVHSLADRVARLLDAGTPLVKIVTDHGWLLLPGGLPKVELSKHLVETQWVRCASVGLGHSVEQPTLPWRWNDLVQITSPSGCGAFRAGEEYAHGGISPQECVTPVLTVRRSGTSAAGVSITNVEWKGLMARVTLVGERAGMTLDIRTDAGVAATSLREADSKSEVSPGQLGRVYLADEAAAKHAGAPAEIVVLDPIGTVLARYRVTIP